jgi:hypothetical protein
MIALFATQSSSLQLFEGLRAALIQRGKLSKAGFIVADSWYYRSWRKAHPDFEHQGHALLKEWEITARRSDRVDYELLTVRTVRLCRIIDAA